MSFDYYALLHQNINSDSLGKCNRGGLASGFVDACTVYCSREREKAREHYINNASVDQSSHVLSELLKEPNQSSYPNAHWLGLTVSFTLVSPWYSKDDRPFHVLDNPVRKDRVFGVPFMSASSWKGMLRFACRMQANLLEHLESKKGKDHWCDPAWITHLFGNEQNEKEDFYAGALVFYPTWFEKVGFEVINPHSREKRAGTVPIFYEVVPPGTKGEFKLLYAPLPLDQENNAVKPIEFMDELIDSIKALLETYGFSAKRTAGWGSATIDQWTGTLMPKQPIQNHKKKNITLNSFQDLGAALGIVNQYQFSPNPINDAEDFKKEWKKRLTEHGGNP